MRKLDPKEMNRRAKWALALSFAVLSVSLVVDSQPSACTEDSQCTSGFYCEETTHLCIKCLRCEELKREVRFSPDVCVKSVTECGTCLKGLVEDLRLDRACVLLGQRSDNNDSQLPTYAWISIGLLFIAFLITIGYVLWRNDTWTTILGVRTSTCASVHQQVHPVSSNGGVAPKPTAPESPPPYTFYEPVRPQSPSENDQQSPQEAEETAVPFIKRTGQGPAPGSWQAECSQAAQPFNYPNYVRGPTTGLGIQEDTGPVPTFIHHDEDTMESLWTPNDNTNHYNGDISDNATDSGAASMAGAGAVTAGAALARRGPADAAGPPAKAARLLEDTNNNRGRESSSGSGHDSPAGDARAPAHSVVINLGVFTNISNVEQRNSVNMPKH